MTWFYAFKAKCPSCGNDTHWETMVSCTVFTNEKIEHYEENDMIECRYCKNVFDKKENTVFDDSHSIAEGFILGLCDTEGNHIK